MFEDGFTQTDFRVTKTFSMGHTKVKGMIDAYNLFNTAGILTQNFAYGPQFRVPFAILGARLLKFGVEVNY